MTGIVTTCSGSRIELPPLLQWSIKLTDGDPCDGFSAQFPHERAWADVLEKAVYFTAVENGKTVFTGVVDDYETGFDRRGLLTEITGRSMAARLLDNQVRAAEYVCAQLEDILETYVRPYGIRKIRAEKMEPVERFVVETGYTCWQVLTGFCRHSADVRPRFLPDGTLVLEKAKVGENKKLYARACVQACLRDSRYGVSSEQIVVNTRTGEQITATNQAFAALGGQCVKVHGRTGDKLRASWRTAQQRLDDDRRGKRIMEVRVAECFFAQPLDCVSVQLEPMGIEGKYIVQAAESGCGENGRYCVVTMREE